MFVKIVIMIFVFIMKGMKRRFLGLGCLFWEIFWINMMFRFFSFFFCF